MAGQDRTRRRFLAEMGAVVGAGVGARTLGDLALGGPDASAATASAAGSLAGIDHVVVLMLENRSFDNVLGWLYDPANPAPFDQVPAGQSFDGLSGKSLSNPVPGGGVAVPGRETVLSNPNPDPGEVFDHVYAQLFDTTATPVPNRTDVPAMQGFVNDYADVLASYNATHTPQIDPRIIMNGFGPEHVPALSALANGYAVCDHWYSSIPTQTYANRSFLHAGTASGYVNDVWKTGPEIWDVAVFLNDTTTIFNLLEAAGISWNIYYGGSLAFCVSFLTQERLQSYATVDPTTNRFWHMPQFYADAAAGNLPSYTFIEPHFFSSLTYGPENDGHPPVNPIDIDGPSLLSRADKLVGDVYLALRNSATWDRTLFLITFDEHGGTYDHVPPPLAARPDDVVVPVNQPGGSGFEFGRLGCRVPTIIVSPLVEQGLVVNSAFDHTSVIKTVVNCFDVRDGTGNPATLLAREAAAQDVSEAVTRTTPRTDSVDIPFVEPPAFDGTVPRALSGLQSDIVASAAALLERRGVPLPYHWTEIATTQQATDELDARIEALRVGATPPPATATPVQPKFTG
jgi:phospholipase C